MHFLLAPHGGLKGPHSSNFCPCQLTQPGISQAGLSKYRRRIMSGLVFIGTGLVVVLLTFFLTCRPFRHLWQVNPNPGSKSAAKPLYTLRDRIPLLTLPCQVNCQPAISPGILLTLYVINVITDFYLIYLPLPMLWRSTLQRRVKMGLCFLFCCAIFIVLAATIRTALISTVRYPYSPSSTNLSPAQHRGPQGWEVALYFLKSPWLLILGLSSSITPRAPGFPDRGLCGKPSSR